LVVLIDDPDRLNRDEVMTILKMVRLTANFPNSSVYRPSMRTALDAWREEPVVVRKPTGDGFLRRSFKYPLSLSAVDRTAGCLHDAARPSCVRRGEG
jgi:KAP family P-loop domain